MCEVILINLIQQFIIFSNCNIEIYNNHLIILKIKEFSLHTTHQDLK